jgi:hypothetical protein
MDTTGTDWHCKTCGFKTNQPVAVSAVSHLCGRGKHRRNLHQTKPDTIKEPTT